MVAFPSSVGFPAGSVTDRIHGSKGRLEFRDEVGFEGTNFQTVPYFLFSNLVWQLSVPSSVSGYCSYASSKWSPYIEWFKTFDFIIEMRGQPNWQKIVWICWSTLFVEGPTLTVDHALTLDHATVDLSIRLHSLGGEVVQFQLCAARWHLVSIAGVRDLPSVLVKYGSLSSPI